MIRYRSCLGCGISARFAGRLCPHCKEEENRIEREKARHLKAKQPKPLKRQCWMCLELKPAHDFTGELCGPCHRGDAE